MRKMIMALVPRNQTEPILEALVTAGYTATVTDSRGGVLRQAQHLLYIAVTEADLTKVLAILRHPQEDTEDTENTNAKASTITSNRPEKQQIKAQTTSDIDTIGFDKQVIFVWDLDLFKIY